MAQVHRVLLHYIILVFTLGVIEASADDKSERSAAGYQVINLGDDFYDLYKLSETMENERRTSFIAESLVKKFPAFYKDKEGVAESDEYSLLSRVSAAVQNFPSIEVEYLSWGRSLSEGLNRTLESFRKIFFNMEMNVPIFMLHSFGSFNGGVQKVDGKSHLMFGLDLMAKYHSWENDAPFFYHELFHVYHKSYFEQCEPLWCDVWSDGLATYISYKLNSDAGYDEMMLNIPEDMAADIEQKLVFALQDFKSKFYSTDSDVKSVLTSFSTDDTSLPSRRGYYLGYLLAKRLEQKHSDIELAQMNAEQVEGLLFEELNSMIDKNSG